MVNTSDLHTLCHNKLLHEYQAPDLEWSTKAQMQGLPAREAVKLLLQQSHLQHIPLDEYMGKLSALHQQYFPTAKVLPGVDALLLTLRYRVDNVHMAIATSSSAANVQLKIKNLKDTFALFQPERILVGDDLRIPKGRGKPCPDIYLQSLKSINEGLKEDEKPILPIECLVLEDGIPGVTAGRRAGMRVAWVPHPDLASLIKGSEAEVLAGKGMKNNEDCYELGFAGDGWGEQLSSLQSFPFEKYGMDVRYG